MNGGWVRARRERPQLPSGVLLPWLPLPPGAVAGDLTHCLLFGVPALPGGRALSGLLCSSVFEKVVSQLQCGSFSQTLPGVSAAGSQGHWSPGPTQAGPRHV